MGRFNMQAHTLVTIKCTVCDKEVPQWLEGITPKMYCSQRCGAKASRRRIAGNPIHNRTKAQRQGLHV